MYCLRTSGWVGFRCCPRHCRLGMDEDLAGFGPDFVLEISGGQGRVVATFQCHRVVLALGSSALAHALEVQKDVNKLTLENDDPDSWAEVIQRLYRPFRPTHARGPDWNAASVEKVLPIAHKYNMQGLLTECLAWCAHFNLSPNRHSPHYVVKWLHIAESLQLDSLAQRCANYMRAWPLSTVKGHPLYVLDMLAVAEAQKWDWLISHCLAYLTPPPLSSLSDLGSGKLATLQALLEDEEGCSRLSSRTLLAIAKLPYSLLPSLEGAQTAVAAVACSNPGCNGRLALFKSPPMGIRAGFPSLIGSDRVWEVSKVPCPCGGYFTTSQSQPSSPSSPGAGAGAGAAGELGFNIQQDLPGMGGAGQVPDGIVAHVQPQQQAGPQQQHQQHQQIQHQHPYLPNHNHHHHHHHHHQQGGGAGGGHWLAPSLIGFNNGGWGSSGSLGGASGSGGLTELPELASKFLRLR